MSDMHDKPRQDCGDNRTENSRPQMNMFARLSRFHTQPYASYALLLFFMAVACAAYLQALNYPFVSDDGGYIVRNTKLAELHATELWRLLVEPFNIVEFLPLRDFSYWLDIQLSGLNPSAFRIQNIVLYVLCCLLVYGTTLTIWRYSCPDREEDASWAAAIVAALFAIHPAHVEAVVWVSGRKDVLSGMFTLLALWLAMKVKRESGFSPLYVAATLLALLAAMLSKATAVVIVPIIAILWLMFWRDIPSSSRRRVTLLWPLASLLLAASVILIFYSYSSIKAQAYWGGETFTRMFAIMGWMLRLAVSPESRQYFYPVFEDRWLYGMVASGVMVTMAAGAVMLLRQRRVEGLALPVFVLLCLPYVQLIPFSTHTLVADRFLFLPVWPILLLLVWAVWRLKPAARALILLAIAIPWIYQTIERTKDWHSDRALLEADVRAYPGHYEPAASYILWVLMPSGLTQEADRLANGITQPDVREIVLELIRAHDAVQNAVNDAELPVSNLNAVVTRLWNVGEKLGRIPAQRAWNPPMDLPYSIGSSSLNTEWNTLAKKFPDNSVVRFNLGLWQLKMHRYENAAFNFRAVIESPQLPEGMRGIVMKNLGMALWQAGHVAEAEAPLRAALQQTQPDLEANCPLAEILRLTGRSAQASEFEARCRQGR